MLIRPFLLALSAAGAVAAGQTTTSDRAKAFQLDSIAPDAAASPTPTPTPTASPSPVAAQPDTAATTPASEALRPSFTLDTPISVLIADPAARAVLDRDLPGMSTDENLDKFAKLGLRQFQPLTGGQLTDAMLVKVARDLSSLGGPLLAPITPTATGNSKRNRDASR